MQLVLMVKWLTAHVTVNLPEDLHDRIMKHKEIKWAAVAREAMIKYLDMIEEAKGKKTI